MTACVCYVIDDNYLFPTLISAIQAQQNVDNNVVDIIVFCVSDVPDRSAEVSVIASTYGVRLIVVPLKVIDKMHPMFGRLFIHRMLPKSYHRVVYIDGDTQIKGNLQPLVDAKIQDGRFLAVRDPDVMFASLSKNRLKNLRSSRAAIGIENHVEYFNSGVLIFNASDWPSLSSQALNAVRMAKSELNFPDQDALNISVGEKCTYIPNKWNFPGFLIGSEMEKAVSPTIYHFMSNPRPWTHLVRPWGLAWTAPYRRMLELHSVLNDNVPSTKGMVKLKYWLQQNFKVVSEYGPVGRMRELDADLYP